MKKKHTYRKNSNINKKLNKIVDIEEQLLAEEKRVEGKEQQLYTEEKGIEDIKKSVSGENSELEHLEQIETEIKNEVGEHPLAQITIRDVVKGLVGAFIGLAIHYTFVYGVEISEELTILRATMLFPFTFIVGLLFIYATGFRKVKDKKLLVFMPVRLLILYVCAISMSVVVLYLFYPHFGEEFWTSYKMVAGVMLAAVVGACTADLLGKE